ALLDSGATNCFVDRAWVQEKCLRLLPLPKNIPVFNIDRTTNCTGEVFHGLGKDPIILRHTWLQTHNPEVNWVTGKVSLNRCPRECCELQESPYAKKLLKEELKENCVTSMTFWPHLTHLQTTSALQVALVLLQVSALKAKIS
ncbi:hypothetical protein ID866_8841, partial [Astraeus odoratus]